MNWKMPGAGNFNPLENEFYNSNDGWEAVWQSFMDYYLQGNGSPNARNAMSRMFNPQFTKYSAWSMANPTIPKRFDQWLEENQQGAMAEWNNSSRSARGGDGRGFAVRPRALW